MNVSIKLKSNHRVVTKTVTEIHSDDNRITLLYDKETNGNITTCDEPNITFDMGSISEISIRP